MTIKLEKTFISGRITETKQEDRNGVPVGILSGFGATWDLDRGNWIGVKDRFVKGAFVESILEHIQKKRQIRMLNQHTNAIGGFPLEFVREDEKGLFVVGEVNLEIQEGAEVYALAKQGVLTDFSIGFSVDEFEMDGDIRTIRKATIWEISTVMEPMNPEAQITQVKNKGEDMKIYESSDVAQWTERDAEKALHEGAQFSKNAAKTVMSIISKAGVATAMDTLAKDAEQKTLSEMLESINGMSDTIKA